MLDEQTTFPFVELNWPSVYQSRWEQNSIWKLNWVMVFALNIVGNVLDGEEKIVGGISRRVEKVGFVEVDSEAQDLMIKFIFDHQRKEVFEVKK